MSNSKIIISVIPVENGFVVLDDRYSGPSFPAPKWVAKDVPDLLKVIQNIYDPKDGSVR